MQVLIAGSQESVAIERPDFVFDPLDPWARIFREALSALDFGGLHIFDAGCGSGSEVIQLLHQSAPRAVVLNDRSEQVMDVALRNVAQYNGHISVRSCVGDVTDVLAHWKGEKLDRIIGCLPQVPAAGDDLAAGDTMAHEYDEQKHSVFKEWGLGLLFDLKRASRRALVPSGSLVLVHSGRVPERIRAEMDAQAGFRETRVICERMIKHHSGTPLSCLFGIADQVLFSDPDKCCPISAEEAEKLRLAFVSGEILEPDYRVYHSVLVVESVPVW
ncbi:MAG: hypothetical protein U1C18_00940 [Patescibacteria group bacterium]|nr:hypothetical protein [Patescibacteria group bacterium]